VRSISKSITSALLGIALGAGAEAALAPPLFDYFPEHADLATAEKRTITLRHALAMSAGLDWREEASRPGGRQDEVVMLHSASPLRFALGRALVAPPGTRFNYNGGLTQLLAEVVERTSRRPLVTYARAVLFEPLGITDLEWLGDLEGTPSAASGLRLRPRDLAKFGSLYLHGGRWSPRCAWS
jgi:CubicO group peptidase (beta-lactamase class C family)